MLYLYNIRISTAMQARIIFLYYDFQDTRRPIYNGMVLVGSVFGILFSDILVFLELLW